MLKMLHHTFLRIKVFTMFFNCTKYKLRHLNIREIFIIPDEKGKLAKKFIGWIE